MDVPHLTAVIVLSALATAVVHINRIQLRLENSDLIKAFQKATRAEATQ